MESKIIDYNKQLILKLIKFILAQVFNYCVNWRSTAYSPAIIGPESVIEGQGKHGDRVGRVLEPRLQVLRVAWQQQTCLSNNKHVIATMTNMSYKDNNKHALATKIMPEYTSSTQFI